jgi:tetratricopeptide (TPR) repeat protein
MEAGKLAKTLLIFRFLYSRYIQQFSLSVDQLNPLPDILKHDLSSQNIDRVACFRRAVEVSPEDPSCHLELAESLADNGLIKDAVGVYGRVISLDPSVKAAHFQREKLLASLEQRPQLKKCWKRMVGVGLSAGHIAMARSLRYEGKIAASLKNYSLGVLDNQKVAHEFPMKIVQGISN